MTGGSRVGLIAQAVALVLLLLLPTLASLSGYQLHIVELILLTIPLGIGLLISMGHCGQINLAQVALYGVGAYTTAILITRAHVDPWPATFVGALAGGVIGMIVGLPSLRIRGHYLAIATLGLAVAAETIFTAGGELTGGPLGIGRIPTLPGIDTSEGRDAGYYPLLVGFFAVAWVICPDARCGSDRLRLRGDPRRSPCGQGRGSERRGVPVAGLHHRRSVGRDGGRALRHVERIHQPRLLSAGADVLPADDPGRRRHAESARSGDRDDGIDRCARGIPAVRGIPAHHLRQPGHPGHAGRPGRPGRLGRPCACGGSGRRHQRALGGRPRRPSGPHCRHDRERD